MKNNLKFLIFNLKSNCLLKISNFKFQISVQQNGFTIVEVLVVAAILGVIGYMLSDIVFRSLQGSQKTAVIGTSKQNGQVALDAVSQVIRNSDLVVCVDAAIPSPTGSTSGDTIALYTQDGRYIRFSYTTIGNTTLIEDQPLVDVLINNDPSVPKSLQANICNTTIYPLTNRTVLTDIDSINGVLIQKTGGTTPIFTVTKRPGSKDNVSVQFDVKPSNTGSGFENQLGGTGVVSFQQTIQLR